MLPQDYALNLAVSQEKKHRLEKCCRAEERRAYQFFLLIDQIDLLDSKALSGCRTLREMFCRHKVSLVAAMPLAVVTCGTGSGCSEGEEVSPPST